MPPKKKQRKDTNGVKKDKKVENVESAQACKLEENWFENTTSKVFIGAHLSIVGKYDNRKLQ